MIQRPTIFLYQYPSDEMDSSVLVSIIGGGFSLLGILLHKSIKENREDHGIVRDSLNRIETKIDGHIDGHK